MSENGKVPFLDLVTPHMMLEEELVAVFRGVLRTAAFVGGPMVDEFEKDFAQVCGVQHCIGVASGTDALRFALMASGVQPGDTVLTVPNTFIATAEAITQAGARPDFVDIDERTYLMDSRKLWEYVETQCTRDGADGKLVNKKTGSPVTAVIPVHLYGQPVDMDPILDLAEGYNLKVIEDACQAHGAAYYSQRESRWVKAGATGVASAFSFYPGKNLGACGEAGAVTTNDSWIAERVRMLRDHGQRRKHDHEIEGYNGRLDALQAGILRAKLKHLAMWNLERRARAAKYDELLGAYSKSITLPFVQPRTMPVYHLYVIRIADREGVRTRLAEAGIATQVHYPVPLHLQAAYASLGYGKGDFPVAEKVSQEILSLPMYPQLTVRQQESVAQELVEALEASSVNKHARPLSGERSAA